MVRSVITGFGRIGRTTLRAWMGRDDLKSEVDIVAVNTSGSMEAKDWGFLLKYDSNYGVFNKQFEVEQVKKVEEVTDDDPIIGYINFEGRHIPMLAQRDPEKLPWIGYNVDVVIECTGKFRDSKKAGKHLKSGAKKVLISAPSKGEDIGTFVLGVNQYDPNMPIADNASCTTNCIAPVVKIIQEKLGIKKAALSTVHSYTDDQNLQDGSHEDLRRARGAALNIVPTTTGAAVAVTRTMPELKGKFDGVAIRVPTAVGSLSDLTFLVSRPTDVEEVNKILTEASQSEEYRRYVAVTNEPLVSRDIVGRNESTIVDLEMTQVIDGDLVKILAWYDNEWGYCQRLIEQTLEVGRSINR